MRLVFFSLISSLAAFCECAAILGLVPMPSKSHYIVVGRLLKELAKRGHRVTVVSAFPEEDESVANYTHVSVPDILKSFDGMDMLKRKKFSPYENVNFLHQIGYLFSKITLKEPKIQALIKTDNGRFDLILSEATLIDPVYAGFSWAHNAPVIGFATLMPAYWAQYMVGNAGPYSYIPDLFLGYSTRMTFGERLINTIFGLVNDVHYRTIMIPKQDTLMRKYFGNDLPSIDEIIRNVSLVFINHHFSLAYPRPYVSNMIEIGGIHVDPPKPLPKDLQNFMDNAKQGVILFSLGSNIKSSLMPKEKIRMILDAFAQLSQKVLWKFETDNLPRLPPNVNISKWFPQSDLLAHPNLKVFITHGGLLSTTEAVHRGVPIIGIPIFGDQPLNMKETVNAGFGITLDYDELTSDVIVNAVNEIIRNPRYRNNVELRSRLLRDQHQTPLEKAVFWVEYVLRHKGAPHLRSSAQCLKWYELYLLDVFAFLGLITLTVLFVAYKGIRLMLKFFTQQKKGNFKAV